MDLEKSLSSIKDVVGNLTDWLRKRIDYLRLNVQTFSIPETMSTAAVLGSVRRRAPISVDLGLHSPTAADQILKETKRSLFMYNLIFGSLCEILHKMQAGCVYVALSMRASADFFLCVRKQRFTILGQRPLADPYVSFLAY